MQDDARRSDAIRVAIGESEHRRLDSMRRLSWKPCGAPYIHSKRRKCMKTQDNVETIKSMGRVPKHAGVRSGFVAMMMCLLVFFVGHAQAEPTVANQYLQVAKNNFAVAKINFQIGSSYAQAGNVAVARQYFTIASINVAQMRQSAAVLYSQNIDTLNRGLYRNLYYQQQAVAYSNILQIQAQVLSLHLSILSQSPLSTSSRISAEISIAQINVTLLNLEQAMRLAQI